MTRDTKINDAVKGLVNSNTQKSFDYAVTLISGVIPGIGLIKDINNHIQQDRIVKVLQMLNDKNVDPEELFKEIQRDERIFDLFTKLVVKSLESGDKTKREINVSLFIDFYSSDDSMKSDFTFSLMESISLLTEEEILLLVKMTKVFEEYANKKESGQVLGASVSEVYAELDRDPAKEWNYDIDTINYIFTRLSYAGFLIIPYGAILSADVFSYRFNVTVIQKVLGLVNSSTFEA